MSRMIVMGVFVFLVAFPVFAATVSWSIRRQDWYRESDNPLITTTTINGGVESKDDASGASIMGMIFTRTDTDGTHIKVYDYSGTAAPVNTRWLLAFYGDMLEVSTLPSFKDVELTASYDFGTGGDKSADPSDFYLVFVAENWEDYVSGAANPHRWYGWVNLAVNADGALDVIGSDVAVYGDPLTVGGGTTPEPSSGLLLLLGTAMLAGRRKNG